MGPFAQDTYVFKDIAVVGLGLMGASFAKAVAAAQPGTRLLGVDTDPATVHKAVKRGIVAAAGEDLELARAADLIVLAVPVGAMAGVLPRLAGHSGTVTDMASVKAPVMALAAAAGVDLVGGHPMCGREVSGIDAADGAIFEAAPWILTRAHPELEGLIRALGSRPLILDAATHDQLVAGISHAAFSVSAAYMLALSGAADWAAMSVVAGSGFRDMTRLASGDPKMYSSVARANREALVPRLDAVIDQLTKLRRHLEHDDPRLVELFEEAHSARERWLRDRGGKG